MQPQQDPPSAVKSCGPSYKAALCMLSRAGLPRLADLLHYSALRRLWCSSPLPAPLSPSPSMIKQQQQLLLCAEWFGVAAVSVLG